MAQRKHKSKKHSTRSKPKGSPRGTFEANPRGFGFVKTSEGEFFIPESKTRDAMDGDIVEIAPVRSDRKKAPGAGAVAPGKRGMGTRPRAGKRDEARVLRVVERRHTELIGTYEVAEPFGIVVPEDPRIKHDVFTQRSKNPDIESGAMVRVRILEYPTRKSAATGEVIEVFGEEGSTDLSIERIISRYNLETAFSEGSVAEAAAAKLDVKAALDGGYRDIRDRFVFTIDPTDAKDFDDALSLECTAAGEFRLGVHIADVSAYVGWGSSIDLDARRRATSVYLADRVIPMLPPELSESLCSLRPGEDRLCMTVDLVLDASARLLEYDVYPAVMRSAARLTYDQAQMLLDELSDGVDVLGGGATQAGAGVGAAGGAGAEAGANSATGAGAEASATRAGSIDPLTWRLAACSQLARARQRHRASQGGLEFTTKEAKVALDSDGHATGIVVREKTQATELIEEAMIYANEVVATYLSDREMPCAYRVHEAPAIDSLEALVPILQEFKWFTSEMAHGLPTANSHVIQQVLAACDGRIEQEMVTMLVLRAMMRATYTPDNGGHYGLGLRCYCHFTSPIRRYPDLMVHRMLKESLGFAQGGFKDQAKSMKWLCEHSSEMERNAEAASFDSQKAKIAEYMAAFLGEEFDAIVSGVVSYGLYVRLENCAEGLVAVRTLGDEYFAFDGAKHQLRGVESNAAYHLGQRVCVRLVEADADLARLDFVLVDD